MIRTQPILTAEQANFTDELYRQRLRALLSVDDEVSLNLSGVMRCGWCCVAGVELLVTRNSFFLPFWLDDATRARCDAKYCLQNERPNRCIRRQ
jgi:hypothetical protein